MNKHSQEFYLKYLLMLLAVVSCASHQNIHKPVSGDAYSMIVEKNGNPHSCVDIADQKYCKWSPNSLVSYFKGDKFVDYISEPSSNTETTVQRECMAVDQKFESKYQAIPGNKKLNPKSLEWKIQFQKIEKVLKASGVQFDNGNQKLEISFGRKDLSEHSDKHYLNFKAVNGEEELWSLKVSTMVSYMDYNDSLPLLLLASYDLVNNPTNTSNDLKFSEKSLQVIAFRHFIQSK